MNKFIKVEKDDFVSLLGNEISPHDLRRTTILINGTTLLIKSCDDNNNCKKTIKDIEDALNAHDISYTKSSTSQINTFVNNNPQWQTEKIDDFIKDKRKSNS